MPTPETSATISSIKSPASRSWSRLTAPAGCEEAVEKEAQKNREVLSSALLSSLQMQHLIALVGSGCSKAADGPTMLDLWGKVVGAPPTEAAKTVAGKIRHD